MREQDPKLSTFIARCRYICDTLGEKTSWYRMYQDDQMRIVEGMNSMDAFRIEILPPDHTYDTVVLFDAEGNIRRSTPAWEILEKHVSELAPDVG